ncbi:hypothetical protein EON81_11860 [bacterium]|nr:MAG: hypothetical protein EON81_11860 [bacterium]
MTLAARLASLTVLAVLFGCGADSNVSASEENAYKNPDKSKIKGPPPGANKPPADFKSSINDGVGSN